MGLCLPLLPQIRTQPPSSSSAPSLLWAPRLVTVPPEELPLDLDELRSNSICSQRGQILATAYISLGGTISEAACVCVSGPSKYDRPEITAKSLWSWRARLHSKHLLPQFKLDFHAMQLTGFFPGSKTETDWMLLNPIKESRSPLFVIVAKECITVFTHSTKGPDNMELQKHTMWRFC